jgi:hypothetical protein
MKISIFLCYTPYHFLIAQTLASTIEHKSIIAFVDESNCLEMHPELYYYKESSLVRISKTEFPSVVRRWWSRLGSMNEIRRIAEYCDKKFNHVNTYIFNSRREESQFVTTYPWKVPSCNYLIEDGAGIYWDEHYPSNQTFLQKFPKKLIYWNYKEITEYTATFTKSGVLALHPQMVTPSNYPNISIKGICQKTFKDTVEAVASAIKFDFSAEEAICISLQNTAKFKSKNDFNLYIKHVQLQIASSETSAKSIVFMKLHPRELHPDLFPKFSVSTRIIPQSIPFEVIIALLPKSTTYYCPWSTVVTAGIVINPHAKFIVNAKGRDARAARKFSNITPFVILHED